ncbi:acylphosphatase [Brachybacterium squillarum]|uniref:acylphosphatase n=1 Tax=Brachybacterium squillarum TaxID=661979 RepID=UPI000262A200|nr:acylphosphatase [Brachybacterium squillarum]
MTPSPSPDPVRRLVRVRGRVQGVGFRWATAGQAERLGVRGTVRNLLDGSVEAVIEGSPEAVEAMLDWLREGPRTARVDGITEREETPRGEKTFRIAD